MITALALALVLCGLWTASAFAVTYGTVHGGWLRLRANPSYNATVITSYRNGTVVTVLSQSDGWARVLTADYRIGYMDSRYLYISSDPWVTSAPTAQPVARTWTEINRYAYVTSSNGKGVRMRSAPAVNSSNVMGLYPVGRTVLEIRRSSDGWSYIQIDGKYGYMMTRFLSTSYEYNTPVPTSAPTPPGPVPTATPAPTSSTEFYFKGIVPWMPKAGDTITAVYTPENAQVTVVWYDGSTNAYLSTGKTFTVKTEQVGHVIKYHVVGAGAYSMVTVDGESGVVQPAE